MADHRCRACGASAPRGAGFCPACGAALDAPALPFDAMAGVGLATEHEVALGAGRSNPKRSALLVGIVAVVVIGSGLIVGTGGGGGDAESRPPATTAAPPTTADRSTRTTVQRTTTTTAIPRFSSTPIPELAGHKLYAVVDDRVVRVDVATGEVTVLGEGSRRPQDWSWLIPRGGGVLLVGDSIAFLADGGEPLVDLGPLTGGVWPAADPGLVWMQTYDRIGGSMAQLVDVATGESLATVEIPLYTNAVADDGAGGVLVQAEGSGIYAMDVAGVATRISDGTFRAASATHLLLFRCDESLACGYEVVERASGQAVPISLPGEEVYPESLVLDPTGTRLAVLSFERAGRISVVEISTGTATELEDPDLLLSGGNYVSWTSDGQHLVWATDTGISVWNVGADQPVRYQLIDDAEGARDVAAVAVGP